MFVFDMLVTYYKGMEFKKMLREVGRALWKGWERAAPYMPPPPGIMWDIGYFTRHHVEISPPPEPEPDPEEELKRLDEGVNAATAEMDTFLRGLGPPPGWHGAAPPRKEPPEAGGPTFPEDQHH